tara:strand:- start:171 stop:920 length:750 start_codon:yes stop_codon:yes gene_type:complete
MHYAGFPCQMENIVSIAKKNNLFIIEDAAHAPLSEYNGKKLGTFGDIGTFSFFSNKNISTGEGGMVITNNKKINDKLRLIRSHGMTTLSYERSKGHATKYDIESLGYNYRMDDIRASIGIIQLNKLKKDLNKRIKIRNMYIKGLKNIPGLIIPFCNNDNYVSNYIFPVVLDSSDEVFRDDIRNKLHQKGIQTSVHYPAVHRFSIYKNYYLNLPNTDYVSNNEITLPMYSSLKKEEISYIIKSLIQILEK